MIVDPEKDAANIAQHGVSPGRAETMFVDDAFIEIDDRRDYGEPRWILYGEIDGRLHVLAFTVRQGDWRGRSA